MLTPPPVKYPRRRGRRRTEAAATSPPPPVALTLVSAVYAPGPPTALTLAFDRAIDIAGIDGGSIILADGEFWLEVFNANGPATLDNPTTVTIELVSFD